MEKGGEEGADNQPWTAGKGLRSAVSCFCVYQHRPGGAAPPDQPHYVRESVAATRGTLSKCRTRQEQKRPNTSTCLVRQCKLYALSYGIISYFSGKTRRSPHLLVNDL